ncbi:hypothetical protein CGCTS75_v009099 [Colletotrichum tropicale]|nr:hypothetical protein CGCTS75_v009099 [Colletotrichum tropicale]
MNNYLAPLVSNAEIQDLLTRFEAKLRDNDPQTRVTRREVAIYKRNFAARVVRNMRSRDYLDDDKTTLEVRLDTMRAIHQTIDTHEDFTPMYESDKRTLRSGRLWASMLTMDFDLLLKFKEKLSIGGRSEKRDVLYSFLQSVNGDGLKYLGWWFHEIPTSPKEEVWTRKPTQRDLALKRDGFRCVWTLKFICHVCHIVPFWSLTRRLEIQEKVLRPLRAILGDVFHDKLSALVEKNTKPGEHDLLDSPANMITMSPSLHKMWDDGKFGIEPLCYDEKWIVIEPETNKERAGSAPLKRGPDESDHQSPTKKAAIGKGKAKDTKSTKDTKEAQETKHTDKLKHMVGLKLRYHWLKRTNLAGINDSPYAPDANPRQMWQSQDHDEEFFADNGTPVDDGQIITIWAESKDLLPDWDLLAIQWLAFRLHRLLGGADVYLYAPQRDQDDDEELQARVIKAKRAATELIAERLGLDADELWQDPLGPYYVEQSQVPPRGAE